MKKKFINTIELSDYEILTDDGFVDARKLHETIPYTVYLLKLSNGLELKCADTHILFKPDFSEVFLRELKPGVEIICSNSIDEPVVCIIESITDLGYEENMFDFELVDGSKRRYWTNGILSHNTETAKTIADEIFGPDSLVRLDMSEYQERHTVSKMIGAPPGYVGYGEGGDLTEKVRRKPFCVVLFDEIEKAHPDVFNTMLQILDEGFLTDRQGRKVNFRNTIILMTSNIGVKQAIEHGAGVGFQSHGSLSKDLEMKSRIERTLRQKFPPEFLNRLNEIITFNTLSEDAIKSIIKLGLNKLGKRIEESGHKFVWNENVVEYIFKDAYEPEYGARPVERTIQRLVEDSISEELLRNEPKDGSTISISYNESDKDNPMKVVISSDEVIPEKKKRGIK